MDYKNAGVDIEAGYKAVELMKKHVQQTMRDEVVGGLGGFSGAFSLKGFMGMAEPTLTILRAARTTRRKSQRLFPVWRRAASRRARL